MAEIKENRRWVLARYPEGLPTNEDVIMETVPVPELKDNEFLIHNHYLSVDPYQRGRMRDVKSYAAQQKLGDLILAGGVGSVVKSNNAEFPVGTTVAGYFGWQEFIVSSGAMLSKVPAGRRLSYTQGVLGMPGATAYFGFLNICEPKPGKTLFVSGAAGAVGALVGQIGKIEGLRVIGSAGTDDKLAWCKGLGFDEVLNYKGKSVTELTAEIGALAPEGIDYYFDNTGGPVTDAVINRMNQFGRVSVCGQIATYNAEKVVTPSIAMLTHALIKQLRIEGFIQNRWPDRTECYRYLEEHIADGSIQVRESVTEGIENALEAFLELFSGANTGKKLVHISDPPTS